MAGTTSIYRVVYHFEANGKKSTQEYIDYVSSAANDYESLKTILSNNNRLQAGKLVFDLVANTGAGSILT